MSTQSSVNSSLRESIEQDEISTSLKDSEILVADANDLTRAVLKKSLQELGFTNIMEASNGLEAIEKLSEKPCDLMLLDMERPEMNGVEVLEAKNKNPKLKEVPTIVISTYEHVDLAVKGIEAGAEDYLVKPFNNTLLRVRVTTSLEKKHLRDMDRARFQVNRALEMARNGLGDMDRILFERLQEKNDLVEIEKEKSDG